MSHTNLLTKLGIFANCAKNFLLRPIGLLFYTFRILSNNMYAWIKLDGKEIMFLNDFWWTCELILKTQQGYDQIESDMMDTQWKVFQFFYQIPPSQQKDLTPCPKSF